MTDAIFQGRSTSRRRTAKGGAGFVSRSKLNTIVMWVLFGILLLLPLFLGGNRPMAWAIGATVLSMVGTFYFLSLLAGDEAPRIGLRQVGVPAALVAVFMSYIVIQVLPIAGWLPHSMSALPQGLPPTASISISVGDTLLALTRWIDIALVAYLSIQIAANSHRAQRFLALLFAVVVVHAVYGLLLLVQFGDTILFTEKWAYKGFATGAFVNRNSFATMLALGACMGVARIADAFQKRPQTGARGFWLLDLREGPLLTLMGLAIIVITLLATGSRMGVAAGVVGMLLVLMLHAVKNPVRSGHPRRRFWPLATATIVVVGIGYLFGLPLLDRFTSVDAASAVRLQLYEQILGMIGDRPLTGFGGGTFEYAYPLYHQSPVDFDYLWDRAHSSYLALWSEYGIAFGSLPMIALGFMLATVVIAQVRGAKPDAFLIAATAGTVAVALHALVDFSLEMHALTLLYTALVAGGTGRALSARQAADGAS